jgi:type VI protein secretion system component VasF
MNAPANLEELCRPVFVCLCGYWQLNQAGHPPEAEAFREAIEASLEQAKHLAGADPVLFRDYERIERPLVFFIDYMVKEGAFPFKQEWRELGRNYNELSGDEKFFNLLSDALQDGQAAGAVPLFYTMLGLGFEGAHAQDPGFIERTMGECAAQCPGELDIREKPIVPAAGEKRIPGSKKGRILRPLRMVLFSSLLLLVFSLIVNLAVFFKATRPFRESLSAAAVQVREMEASASEAP